MKNKILITGATGGLGSKVVGLLKERTGIDNLAVLVRDQENELAKQYANEGIEVKTGDYRDIEGLKKAFEDIDILYFVSAGDDEDRAGLHKNVIDASVKAGIGHIVYTSGISKGENGYSPLAGLVESHRKTEEFLKISGIPYTILRHNLYAEVIGMLIGDKHQLLRTKTIYLPAGNGVTSFIPKKDLADAAVNILLNPTAYENIIVEFNGSEQLSFPQIAKILTSVLKEPIKYISPEISEFESQMSKFGVPDHIIDILSTFSSAIEIGEFDQQSKDLERVLGRKTSSLSDFLENAYR